MHTIEVRKADPKEIERLEAKSWPIWECAPSTFDWHYDEKETCYILEGKVTVTSKGQSVSFGAGDLVIFPQGLSCTWTVSKAVRKHYKFG